MLDRGAACFGAVPGDAAVALRGERARAAEGESRCGAREAGGLVQEGRLQVHFEGLFVAARDEVKGRADQEGEARAEEVLVESIEKDE